MDLRRTSTCSLRDYCQDKCIVLSDHKGECTADVRASRIEAYPQRTIILRCSDYHPCPLSTDELTNFLGGSPLLDDSTGKINLPVCLDLGVDDDEPSIDVHP